MDRYVIDFFKRVGFYDELYFNSIRVTVIDKKYDDIKDLVGFYPELNKMVLPKIKTIRDMLVWVHEYSHALFPEEDDEIFPNLMEAYFINNYIYDENARRELKKNTLSEIKRSEDLDHSMAKIIKLYAIKNF